MKCVIAENDVMRKDTIKARKLSLSAMVSWAMDQAVDERNLCALVENSSDNFPLGPINIERIFVPQIE